MEHLGEVKGQGEAEGHGSRARTEDAGSGGGATSPEEPRVLHVLSVVVVGLLCTNAHPEKVLGLLALVDDLGGEGWSAQGPLLARPHLITPPPGEAARLLGRPVTDPLKDALALAGLGCPALLKGATTVIPVGAVPWLSASGCAGMAKGGSGDVLTGLAVGLMAQCTASGTSLSGEALAKCAAMASEIHGRAGELAQQRVGVRGMCASDIVDALPQALTGYA